MYTYVAVYASKVHSNLLMLASHGCYNYCMCKKILEREKLDKLSKQKPIHQVLSIVFYFRLGVAIHVARVETGSASLIQIVQ